MPSAAFSTHVDRLAVQGSLLQRRKPVGREVDHLGEVLAELVAVALGDGRPKPLAEDPQVNRERHMVGSLVGTVVSA